METTKLGGSTDTVRRRLGPQACRHRFVCRPSRRGAEQRSIPARAKRERSLPAGGRAPSRGPERRTTSRIERTPDHEKRQQSVARGCATSHGCERGGDITRTAATNRTAVRKQRGTRRARLDGLVPAVLVALAVLTGGGTLLAADNATRASASADPHVVRFSPTMPASALAGRPDSDFLELSNGRRLRLGDLRRLTATLRAVRTTPVRPLPLALVAQPAATGTPVKNAADLAAALQLPDTQTVVLPSGRRATVALIKLLQPQVEKQLGRRLTSGRTAP